MYLVSYPSGVEVLTLVLLIIDEGKNLAMFILMTRTDKSITPKSTWFRKLSACSRTVSSSLRFLACVVTVLVLLSRPLIELEVCLLAQQCQGVMSGSWNHKSQVSSSSAKIVEWLGLKPVLGQLRGHYPATQVWKWGLAHYAIMTSRNVQDFYHNSGIASRSLFFLGPC